MTRSEVQYVLPDIASLLTETSFRSELSKVLNNTEKYYSMQDLCRVLPIESCRTMAEFVADSDGPTAQALPALAERLAQLHHVGEALRLANGATGHRRLEALIRIGRYVEPGMIRHSLGLCESARSKLHWKIERRRKPTLVRQAQLGFGVRPSRRWQRFTYCDTRYCDIAHFAVS